MFSPIYRSALVLLVLISFAGCTTLTTADHWPPDIPDRQYFVDGYLKKRNIKRANPEKMQAHLVWIKRFYQGTVIYPNGWTRASTMFLDSISEPQVKSDLSGRLEQLGIAIANEWAQDNDIRQINNTNIATWGSALRTAAELGDHEDYISKVEQDVAMLISGKMLAREINYGRYYPEDDYDNF